MLARHHGEIVLVWGAIPGERVAARVERHAKGLLFAETIDVLSASADRRSLAHDWRCGGNVLAHVSYPRQLQLKSEIIRDAFGRIGRIPLTGSPAVVGSPEAGYRIRARLHAQDGRLGFYREGTHELCDAARTAQLSSATNVWLTHAESVLSAMPRERRSAVAAIEVAESVVGDQRACHVELHSDSPPATYVALADGLVGLSATPADGTEVYRVGAPTITDVISPCENGAALRLQRDVRAFFQGNRFLVERLVRYVLTQIQPGPAVDLYAGVGLFGLSLAASGTGMVTVVEGDPVSSADLQRNAEPFGDRVHVERRSVESYLSRPVRKTDGASVIIDPPRTGVSRDAMAGLLRARPKTVVYVSCDVATLARDARAFIDAGYELGALTAMDLFPNTAHVESIATFTHS